MNPQAMFNISYGLYVLTANLEGKDNGCIINTVTQVTSDPQQITIAVNKSNYTRDMIAASKKFTASCSSASASSRAAQPTNSQASLPPAACPMRPCSSRRAPTPISPAM